jgi:hypothetical protein
VKFLSLQEVPHKLFNSNHVDFTLLLLEQMAAFIEVLFIPGD